MKLRKTLLVVLSLVLMVCLSCITVITATANDKIVLNSSDIESINESYSVGQEINFPSSISVEYKGATYEAKDGLIYYPSGACYELSSHVLDEVGDYTIKYFFETDGGVKVTAVVNISAKTTYFSFTTEDGSKVTPYAEGGNGSEDHENDLYTTRVGGLKVDIKEGNTFTFNVPIDLNKINNSTYNSSNVVQYSVVGGTNEDSQLPEFVQYGTDMYEFGTLDKDGNLVDGDTGLVSGFFAATIAKKPKIKLLNEVSGLEVQVYAYNKAKELMGIFTDENGDTDFSLATEWSSSVASGTSPHISTASSGVSSVAYMRIVVKKSNDAAFSAEDRENVAKQLYVYRTAYVSNTTLAIMRFTDAYDPSIYVEVEIRTDGQQYWQRASTNHQEARGFRVTTSTTSTTKRTLCYVDGQTFLAYGDNYGKVPSSYSQTRVRYGERISFNLSNNRLYSECMTGYSTPTNSNHLLNDFNNDGVYEGNHFQGFTTGEVYVSFYFQEYNKTSSQVIIHGLGDYTVEDLMSWCEKETDVEGNEVLKGKALTYEDKNAPTFQTDFENTDQFGVYASVGDNVKIPEVKAWDVNIVGDMAVNVYRNYNSPQKVKVNVKNGEFIIGAPDTYTIEYSQRDSYGNVGIYTINVIASSKGGGQTIAIDTEKLTTVNAGSTVVLPEYTVTSLNNLDKFEMKITAKSDKETINVDTETMSFLPLYSGTYTLTYEFNDNFGTDVFSYDFEAVANDTSVVYKEVPTLPRYFIKGQKYNIEQAFAYKFETGAPVAEDTDMFIVFDNGERTKIADPIFTEITGNDVAYLVYSLDGIEYQTQNVPIIDVTYYKDGVASGIDMYKYFDGNFVYNDLKADGSGARESNIVYYAIEGAEDMKLSFINRQDYNTFSFKYQVRPDYSNFNKLTFRLFGIQDPSQEILVELVRSGAGTDTEVIAYYLNGQFQSNLANYIWADARTKNFAYTKETNTLTIGSTSLIIPFTFDGSLVDFDVTIGDIFGVAGMMVTNVGNQKFSGTTYTDKVNAVSSIITSQGEYKVGDEVSLNIPTYTDVLSQIDPTSLSFTVTDSDGNPALSQEGVLLDGKANDALGTIYSLKFDKITNYHVKYYGADYNGNQVSLTYMINVIDVDAPVVKLTSVEEGKTYEVNKWGKFDFTYEVSDNVSQTANITVSVVLHDVDKGTWRNNVGTSIQFYYAGNFKVQVLAQDEAGNFSYVTFYVVAK